MLDFTRYPLIPYSTRDTIVRYIDAGLPPGSFVTAVLSNDLVKSVGAADEDNLLALTDIAKFVYNELPVEAWGNQNKVNAWIKKRGNKNDLS